ncbi:hypothetical protein B0H13DRAFT_1861715 [Mycena leptocephala]|nr:hypothetical protein B0H13DRAFT_1861715 [Mycena leptocephala]
MKVELGGNGLSMKVFRRLASIAVAQGDEETGLTLYEVALDGFTFMDIHRWRAECTDHIGTILERRGDIAKAAIFLREAKPLFATSLQTKNSARMETKLLALTQQNSHFRAPRNRNTTSIWRAGVANTISGCTHRQPPATTTADTQHRLAPSEGSLLAWTQLREAAHSPRRMSRANGAVVSRRRMDVRALLETRIDGRLEYHSFILRIVLFPGAPQSGFSALMQFSHSEDTVVDIYNWLPSRLSFEHMHAFNSTSRKFEGFFWENALLNAIQRSIHLWILVFESPVNRPNFDRTRFDFGPVVLMGVDSKSNPARSNHEAIRIRF